MPTLEPGDQGVKVPSEPAQSAEQGGVERCSKCRHAPHENPCLNLASDNDCRCPGGFPAEPIRPPDRYVITTPRGFTESFDRRTVETLVLLGLIVHERDGHVLEDGNGNGVGALHHFYREAPDA